MTWALAVILLWPSMLWASLQLDVGRLQLAGLSAQGTVLFLDGQAGWLRIATLEVAGRQWRGVRLDCPRLRLNDGRVDCRDASIAGVPELADARLELAFSTTTRTANVTVRFAGGGRVVVALGPGEAIKADLAQLPLALAARLLPDLARWQALGTVSGRVRLAGARLDAELHLAGGGFADAAGTHAAEALVGQLQLGATRRDGAWRWQAELAWTAGGVFWDPVFVPPGVSLQANGVLDTRQLSVDALRLQAPGVDAVTGRAVIDRAGPRLMEADMSVHRADLAVMVPQFALPMLAPAQAERWQVAGWADATVQWRDGRLQAAELTLDQAGFAYLGQRFRVGPLSGRLPWHRADARAGRLAVDGLHWQKLDFQPFALEVAVDQGVVSIRPARLPVLDGAIIIDTLTLARTDTDWRGEGSFFMEPVSMRALTRALDLPEMAGTLSASMPGLVVTPQRIGLDGALILAVFDGYVQATGLEVVEPFGLLPRLRANVVAEHLDLAQLTETFSFGAVSGFIDLSLADLQMAAWRPLRFEATVRSTPGDYPRRISQRAVEHITALGGASASAAIQRSFLQFFNDFGYREIGLACRLVRGVCHMQGLEGGGAQSAPFTIVRGGGIPALNVIGYNRRVDWEELIARIKAAVASDAAPVIK
ncbi:MAG: hypothetical protein DWQ11_15790 [Proteobacteria bacterium]|nr:MAG: hypothetical protein DWQ11_15790 [Pseudomonadota bacterium]